MFCVLCCGRGYGRNKIAFFAELGLMNYRSPQQCAQATIKMTIAAIAAIAEIAAIAVIAMLAAMAETAAIAAIAAMAESQT